MAQSVLANQTASLICATNFHSDNPIGTLSHLITENYYPEVILAYVLSPDSKIFN